MHAQGHTVPLVGDVMAYYSQLAWYVGLLRENAMTATRLQIIPCAGTLTWG